MRHHRKTRSWSSIRVFQMLLLLLLWLMGNPVTLRAQSAPPSTPAATPAATPSAVQGTMPPSYTSEVALAWFELSLDLLRETPGFGPPVASRALTYLGVGLYETVQPGLPRGQSLVGRLNGLERVPTLRPGTLLHWPAAANVALAELNRKLFVTATPANLARIDALEAEFAQRYQSESEPGLYQLSALWGRSVAQAIYAWSLVVESQEE